MQIWRARCFIHYQRRADGKVRVLVVDLHEKVPVTAQAQRGLREGGQNTLAMALCTSSLDADTPRAIYLSADDMLLGWGLPSREPCIQALTKGERQRPPFSVRRLT